MAFALLTVLETLSMLGEYSNFLRGPTLEVHDKTEGIFRNLMALEQCHYPFEAYICNYMALLDFLIC